MSKTTYTPGPWRMENSDAGVWFIVAGDGERDNYLADVHRHVGETASDERDEANARLMAAAPDLLAACRMICGMEEDETCTTDNPIRVFPDSLRAIRAAIARAEERAK